MIQVHEIKLQEMSFYDSHFHVNDFGRKCFALSLSLSLSLRAGSFQESEQVTF